MKKRIPLIIIICIVGAAVIFGAILFKNRSTPKTTRGESEISPTQTPSKELSTWEDPAGFSFQYPKGEITIDKHDEDMDNYAHLEFKEGTLSGKLFIWAKDTDATDIGTWVTLDKTRAKASTLDTTLGGLPGKKIIMPEPQKKLIVGTVTDQIIFTVELDAVGDPFWQPVFDEIVKSFQFTNDGSQGGESQASGEEYYGSVDEEEVLE